MALEEVERLRKKGERARLIETNRRKKLYAPYESELKRVESHKESETQGSGKGNVEKQNEIKDTVQNSSTVKPISNELASNTLKELNIINDKNEWNYNKKDEITKWSNVMYVRDGVLKYLRMDLNRVAYVQTEIPTRLSDGNYEVEFDDPGFNGTRVLKSPTEMPEIKPLENGYSNSLMSTLDSNAKGLLEQHKFNYDNSIEFKLEGENLKRFVKALRDQSDDLILFEKADKLIKDPIHPERATIREVIKVKAQSDVAVDPPPTREIMEIIPDHDTIPNLPKGMVSKYAKSYIYKSIEAILGKNQALNPKTPLTINVKNDYPILLRAQWKIGDRDEAKSYGMIAPRITET